MRLLVFLMLVSLSNNLFAQSELKRMFGAKNSAEYEQYLKRISGGTYGNPQSEFRSDLSAIIAGFLDQHVKSEYAKRRETVRDKYFIIQPDLLCALVENIDVDSVRKSEMMMNEDYGLLTMVPGGFGFYNFSNIHKQENVANPADVSVGYANGMMALKLPKVYIDQFNAFLRGNSYLTGKPDRSYGDRSAFLQTKLAPNNPSRTLLAGGREYIVRYDFYIDRVVFNLNKDKAVLQCSYSNGSTEFYFVKQGSQWNLVKKWDLMIFD